MPSYKLKCCDCGKEIEEAITRRFLATGREAQFSDVSCECGSRRFVRVGGDVPARTATRWSEDCD